MTIIERKKRVTERRRSKDRITLWLTPSTTTSLQTQARERRVPMCDLAERFIRKGLEAGAAYKLEQTALPALSDAVRLSLEDYSRRTEDRLAKLLTRNLIASDTTRRLLFAHMAKQWGGAEHIQQAHESARTASINALRERGWAAALRLDVEDQSE